MQIRIYVDLNKSKDSPFLEKIKQFAALGSRVEIDGFRVETDEYGTCFEIRDPFVTQEQWDLKITAVHLRERLDSGLVQAGYFLETDNNGRAEGWVENRKVQDREFTEVKIIGNTFYNVINLYRKIRRGEKPHESWQTQAIAS